MHGDLQVGYRIDDFAYLTDVKTIEDIEIAKPKR
jgi:phosphoribosyl 1,2-cyclic phosphate phosphodiesterase